MKKIHKILGVILACSMLFSLCACGGSRQGNTQEQTYTIQYTDNMGLHSIEVGSGKLYSISSIPEKNGYNFMGLYDAEVGGTQYVNAGGGAVSPFTDNKNIVLYPQFCAKEFTLILDYQGAMATGTRSMKVSYNSEIGELPLNLILENKNFMGWYTEPNCKGNQITDQHGVWLENRKVTEKLFDLSDPNGNIKLYAGFKNEEFTVTFYFTDKGAPEKVQVEYGTAISDVQLKTRVDGKAAIAWSKKRNDTNKEEIFDGKVTSDMVLYAAKFAPVIDFDSNGGNSVEPIIARMGDTINLPTPIRENYKFVGWQTTSGMTFNATMMPANSTKLTAKWQATILFDTNGGTDVTNISEPQGTRITLPETEKAGYVFAGWYDGNGEKYIVTDMPSTSVKLYAKYWKLKKSQFIIIDESSNYGGDWLPESPNTKACTFLDLSELYEAGVKTISVTAHYKSRRKGGILSNPGSSYMAWYSENKPDERYLVWKYSEPFASKNYESFVRDITFDLTSPFLYIFFYCDDAYFTKSYYWTDFWVEIEHPDMSTLY